MGAVQRNITAEEQVEPKAAPPSSVTGHLIAALEDPPKSDLMDLVTLTPLKDPVVMSSGYVVDRATFYDSVGNMRFAYCPFTRIGLSSTGENPSSDFCQILLVFEEHFSFFLVTQCTSFYKQNDGMCACSASSGPVEEACHGMDGWPPQACCRDG